MIPLSDIISRVRTRYEVSDSVRWSDDDIKGYINEALECLAESSDFYERYVTIPIQPDRTWYDLRGFTPEVVVSVKSVWSSIRNDWLHPVDEGDLQFKWEDSTGDPHLFFTRGVHWLGVWPKAGSSTTGELRVYFAGIPNRYTMNQSVLQDLSDDHVPALEDYALHEMAFQDGEPQLAMRYWNSYLEREDKLSKFADHRLDGGITSNFGGRVSGRMGGSPQTEGYLTPTGYL
jgi:hypothetical protein